MIVDEEMPTSERIITNWDELPLILNAKDMQAILTGNGIAPTLETVRGMMHAEGFPLIRGSREMKVYKDALKQYFMQIGERRR